MTEGEWIDIAAAAERYHCSTKTIRRWARLGELAARKERSIGRDGRWVIKTWIRVGDLDHMFRSNAHEEHVRKIRATAQPFTDEQKLALRKVFLEHILAREAKRKVAAAGGASFSGGEEASSRVFGSRAVRGAQVQYRYSGLRYVRHSPTPSAGRLLGGSPVA